METIIVYNQKGGVAKTSLATEIAGNFAMKGLRTLLIDYDAQGNVAQTFGINPEDKKGHDSYKVTFDYLKEGSMDSFKDSISWSVKGNENLDILYGSGDLSQVEISFYEIVMKEKAEAFKKMPEFFKEIEKIIEYDKIVIDCSPALNLFQGNLMNAADTIIIPSMMEKFSQGGILSVVKAMKQLAPLLGQKEDTLVNKIKFVVPTKIKAVKDHQTVHHQLITNLPKILGIDVLPWEEGVPEVTAFARTVREKDTTPVLIKHKNKATEAVTKIVEKYLI